MTLPHLRITALRRLLSRALAVGLLAILPLLGACATPATIAEATMEPIEQGLGAQLAPDLPIEVARSALSALDRGDFHSVRKLFAGSARRRDAAVNAMISRWPVGVLARPEVVSYVGPYTSRARLEPVALGSLDVIPVRYQTAEGDISARLVLQRTDIGWQLIDIR